MYRREVGSATASPRPATSIGMNPPRARRHRGGSDWGRSKMRRLLSVVGIVLVLVGCTGSPGTAPTDGPAARSSAPSAPSGSSAPGETCSPSPASAAPSEAAGNRACCRPPARPGSPSTSPRSSRSCRRSIQPPRRSGTCRRPTRPSEKVVRAPVGQRLEGAVQLLRGRSRVGVLRPKRRGRRLAVAGNGRPGNGGLSDRGPRHGRDRRAKVTDYGSKAATRRSRASRSGSRPHSRAARKAARRWPSRRVWRCSACTRRTWPTSGTICPRDELGNDEFGFFGSLG